MFDQASLTVGDNGSFILNNGNYFSSSIIASSDNNVGQIVFDGKHNQAAFTVGDNTTLLLINEGGSLITNNDSGNDAGQMVLDGNKGLASFTAGDNALINLSNLLSSAIQGGGFDTGQIVIDGDGGTAIFQVGNFASMALTSASEQSFTIASGPDGNIAGQIVIDGNDGSAAFIAGNQASINISNASGSSIISQSSDAGQIVIDGDNNSSAPFSSASMALGNASTLYVINAAECEIASPLNAGQLVVDGNLGTAALFLGDNNSVAVVNNGEILNTNSGALAAQLVFDGSSASFGGVALNAGNDTTITATLGVDGAINNSGVAPAAQFYFHSANVYGNPTLTAINLSENAVEGIVFDGLSSAPLVNIQLQNSTLKLDTTNHPLFTIQSLSGDAFSLVKLNQDLQINMANGGIFAFAGEIYDETGSNNLIISGTGTQILSGANTFGGTTSVDAAALILNGSVAHNLTVNNGGVLSGDGTVFGSVNVNDTSSVALDVETLQIEQNFTQGPNTLYAVQITDQLNSNFLPESSLLDISGSAAIAGSLLISSADGTYAIGRPYTILEAGALSGTYSQVEVLNPFLNVQVLYDYDPSVQIVLSTDFLSGARTHNQREVAQQLDYHLAVPVGDEQEVINNLLALTPAQLPKALDEMAGEQYSYLVGINQFSDFRFRRRIFDAVRNVLDPCHCSCSGLIPWIAFETEYGRMQNRKKSRGFKEHSQDLSVGVHTECASLLYGGALNFESDRISFNLKGTNTLRNIQGALYGAYTAPKFYIFSNLIIGQGESHFKRRIAFADLVQTAHSRPKFSHGLLYAEAGVNFCVKKILIQPFVGGDGCYMDAQGFREHHAEALNLKVRQRTLWSENLYLGSHFNASWNCVQLNADLIYQHRFGRLGTTLHPRFLDFGDSFEILGAKYGRDGFIGALNAAASVAECTDLYLEFAAELWDHRTTYSGSLGLSYCW